MKIAYHKKFLKDLKKINKRNPQFFEKIKHISFNELPAYVEINDISNVKKLINYKNYYRIRVGSYRIGFKKIAIDSIQLLRVLNRKDIFNYFP